MGYRITGLAHIGVPCLDLEESIAFYERFSFEKVVRKDSLNGYHVAMVRVGDCTLELYESLAPDKGQADTRQDGHVDHIALAVENLEGLYGQVRQWGDRIVSNGMESIDLWEEPCHYFIICGPCGERIEFCEVGKDLGEKNPCKSPDFILQ